MIDYADPSPPRDPDDFARNSQGKPWVASPGGKKHQGTKPELVAIAEAKGIEVAAKVTVADLHDLLGPDVKFDLYDRYSHWPLHDWSGTDMTPANRGTHCHSISDMADAGIPLSPEFIAAGEALDIPADIQQEIYDGWVQYRQDIGLRAVLIEFRSVHDAWRKAGTPDRYDEATKDILTPYGLINAGERVISDTKTGGDYTAYLVQLAAAADGLPYDVHQNIRLPWPDDMPPHPRVAIVNHYAIRDRIEGDTSVRWHGKAVDLDVGRWLGNRLKALQEDSDDVVSYAIRPIMGAEVAAAPPSAPTIAPASPPEAGDAPDGLLTRAPSVEHDSGAVADPAAPLSDTPTLDELRADVRQWQPADRAALTAYFDRNDVDTTDAVQVAEAIDAVHAFKDVTTVPFVRDTPAPPPPAARRSDPDEGDAIAPIDAEAAGERYLRLPPEVRSWVTVCGAKVRLSPTHGGKPTRRRFDILRGLCNLAEAGFDDDDMARAVLAHIIGTDEAWQAPHTVADVLATLDAAEAARWATACDTVPTVDLSVRYDTAGRLHIAASVVAA